MFATRDEHLRLGEQQREHGQPLLSLRAEAAQVAIRGKQPHVVQVRPDARGRALDVPLEPRLELGSGRRLAVVDERRARQAELVRDSGESRASSAASVARRAATSSAPSVADLLRPRRDRVTRREPRSDASQRRVALRDRGRVVGRERCARRLQPRERAVEVRAPSQPDRP